MAMVASERRYRMLQTLAEYARERLADSGELDRIRAKHAAFFGDLARAAYLEWEGDPKPMWIQRLSPDLDNFRAALVYSLREAHEVHSGAALAADAAPIFLRLALLREGVGWCEAALAVAGVAPELRGRLHYGLSMLYNNLGALPRALDAARAAVRLFRESGENRGLVRALSQVVQLHLSQHQWEEGTHAADEAIGKARALADPHVLALTLRRCAVLPPEQIDDARARFQESVTIFESLRRHDEAARTLLWWADIESDAGCYERAAELCEKSLNCKRRRDAQMGARRPHKPAACDAQL